MRMHNSDNDKQIVFICHDNDKTERIITVTIMKK